MPAKKPKTKLEKKAENQKGRIDLGKLWDRDDEEADGEYFDRLAGH